MSTLIVLDVNAMRILLINASPRQRLASSYLIAEQLINEVFCASSIIDELDVTSLPPIDIDYAMALCSQGLVTDESKGSLALSNSLISSLTLADIVIVTSPIHNFSLPSGLKCWIDHVVRVRRTFEVSKERKIGTLKSKPVYIIASAGGYFKGDQAYQPDFFTPYLREIFSVIGLNDVYVFILEGSARKADALAKKMDYITEEIRSHLKKHYSSILL